MRARDQGLGACDQVNLIEKILIKPLNATAKKTNYNTKSITYSEMLNYLSICRLTKNVLTLSINY